MKNIMPHPSDILIPDEKSHGHLVFFSHSFTSFLAAFKNLSLGFISLIMMYLDFDFFDLPGWSLLIILNPYVYTSYPV